MNIREVAITTKMSEQAIRRAIKLGNLKSTKLAMNDTQTKYDITEEAVKEWRSNSGNHNMREDGRRKLTMYASNSELEKVKALLIKNNLQQVADLIKLANNHSQNKAE
jgi:hypothetical protein